MNSEQPTVTVMAHKLSTALFAVPNGTRSEIEQSIEERLRSDPTIVWIDNAVGAKVDCLYQDHIWRPRRLFSHIAMDGNVMQRINDGCELKSDGSTSEHKS